MAIRYSGDAEVRLRWDPRRRGYVGSVRDPDFHWRGRVGGREPRGSEDYDRAARELLSSADRACRSEQRRPLLIERTGRDVEVRRVFQAPCPVRTSSRK